jgi:hypothetical protein
MEASSDVILIDNRKDFGYHAPALKSPARNGKLHAWCRWIRPFESRSQIEALVVAAAILLLVRAYHSTWTAHCISNLHVLGREKI